jgi:hypothetical protein
MQQLSFSGNYRKLVRGFYAIILTTLVLASCSKSSPSDNNGSGNGNGGNGGNGGGTKTSTLTYINNAQTAISFIANNQTQSIAAGASLVFTGTPGATFAATATTSEKTSTGTQVGQQISWTLNTTFPSSGDLPNKLDVPSDYFFLKIVNKDILPMTKLYVNYGLTAQTLDNITIPNDGLSYNIGYYKAYTNSNARAENGNTYWYWSNLNLTGTINQICTATGGTSDAPLTDTVVKYKLNGTQYNYTTPGPLNLVGPFPLVGYQLCVYETTTAGFVSPGGLQPLGTDLTIISFGNVTGSSQFTTGTYTEACAGTGLFVMPMFNGYSVKGSGTSQNNYFTLVITEVGSNYIKGTFTGKLSNFKNAITSEATITDGSFKVRLIK